MKSQSGFTLIELMITLTVAGVLMMVAAPSYRELIQSNRMSTQANLLLSDLNAARSEAVKRRIPVTLCKSTTQSACATSGGYEQGWIIFADHDRDGAVDDDDMILRTQDATGTDLTIRGKTPIQNRISFFDSGNVSTSGSIIFCDSRIQVFSTDRVKARAIIISQPGRFRTVTGSDTLVTSCGT
jgi:type IV fimbrial biogenesis protein FimT